MKLVLVLLFVIFLSFGCSKKETTEKSHKGHEHMQGMKSEETSKEEVVLCPVMGTEMEKSKAFDKAEYKGKIYYFCCAGCKPEFLKNPEKYIK